MQFLYLFTVICLFSNIFICKSELSRKFCRLLFSLCKATVKLVEDLEQAEAERSNTASVTE